MITNYQLSNYNYNYNYFKNVINCNWLQLQITITTSLMVMVLKCRHLTGPPCKNNTQDCYVFITVKFYLLQGIEWAVGAWRSFACVTLSQDWSNA